MVWGTVLRVANRPNKIRTNKCTLGFETYRSLATSGRAIDFPGQKGQKWRLKWVKNVRGVEMNTESITHFFRECLKGKKNGSKRKRK